MSYLVPSATTTTPGLITLAGDLGGTGSSPTVISVHGNTVTTGALVKGDLLIATTTSNWAATAVTGDIAFSTSTPGATTVVSISGATPIAITPAALQWAAATASPIIEQATAASDVATQNITIQSQAPFASAVTNLTAGNIILNIPASVSGTAHGNAQVQYNGSPVVSFGSVGTTNYLYMGTIGTAANTDNFISSVNGANMTVSCNNVLFLNGQSQGQLLYNNNTADLLWGNNIINFGVTTLEWVKTITNPILLQLAQTTDTATNSLTIQAQNALAGATTNITGGNLVLTSGTGATTGIPGAVQLQAGSVTAMQVDGYGVCADGYTLPLTGTANSLTLSLADVSRGSILLTGTISQATTLIFPIPVASGIHMWLLDATNLTGISGTNKVTPQINSTSVATSITAAGVYYLFYSSSSGKFWYIAATTN
jgi:hypothetical protein